MFGLKTPNTLIWADLFSDSAGRCIGLVLMQRLVFSDSGSFSNLIAIQFLTLTPAICSGLLMGILIDRSNPKLILLWTNTIRLILVICLFGDISPIVILIIYLMYIVMTNGFAIGISAWIPMLMPENRILTFNARNEGIALMGAAVTPLFIAGLIAEGSVFFALFSASLMLFLSLAAVYYTIPIEPDRVINHFPATKPRHQGNGALFDHFRQAVSGLLYEYMILAAVIFTGMVVAIALPVLHKHIFNGDILLWGFFMSSFQMGAAASSFFLSIKSLRFSKSRILLWGGFTIGLFPALMGVSKDSWVIMVLMFLFGASNTIIQILTVSSVQRHTGARYPGRSMSVLKAYQGICMLIAVCFSSAVIYFFSPQVLFNSGALIGCLGVVLIMRYSDGRKKR